MTRIDPVWATVAELSRAFGARTLSPVDAVERAHAVAGADRPVSALGGQARIRLVDGDERVQFRVVRGDAREQCLDDCHRRQPACGDLGGEAVGGQKARVGVGGGHLAHLGKSRR